MSIVVLVINDRVLKVSYPGSITGKLSDLAGVVMIAMLLVGISGRVRWSLIIVAVSFGLLKTVPAVAEWAVPVLGGRTRTDPTDLIALAALVPLGWWLGRTRSFDGMRGTGSRGRGVRSSDGGDGALVAAAKVGGVFFAVLATSATSCVPYPGFDRVDVAADGTFVASSDEHSSQWRLVLPIDPDAADGNGDVHAWVSDDSAEPAAESAEPDDESSGGPLTDGGTRECLSDGTCVEIRGLSVIEIDPNGDERTVVDFNAERGAINAETTSSCQAEIGARFPDIATNGEVVVVAMGVLGAMVRLPDGAWVRTGADEAVPSLADKAVREQRFGWATIWLPVVVYATGVVVLLARPTRAVGRVLGIVLGLVLLLAIWLVCGVAISLTGSSVFGFGLSAFASAVLAVFMFGMQALRRTTAVSAPDPPYPSPAS